MIRLNLAAGDKYFPGWVNVDSFGDQDVSSDVRKLPFPNDYADHAEAHHILEHIHRREAGPTLTEWFRVLKPGGKLVLELPCLDKMAKLIVEGEKNIRLTLLGLYGDPRDRRPNMDHKWAWSVGELKEMLYGIGFKEVVLEEPVFHIPTRDMRMTAVKP